MGRAALALCVVAGGALVAAAATTAAPGVRTAVPRALFYAGPLMVLVGLVFALLWKRWSRARWRWLWAGAGLWTAGVLLKALWALLLNGPALAALRAATSPGLYVACGAIYIGLLTGVFEIGITVVAALIWPRLARWGHRAVGVGVGAGVFEAVLIGGAAFVVGLVANSGAGGGVRARRPLRRLGSRLWCGWWDRWNGSSPSSVTSRRGRWCFSASPVVAGRRSCTVSCSYRGWTRWRDTST